MRKIIVSTITSLDGFSAGPGGDVMALPMDHFFNEQNLERQRSADTLLLGATTYMGFKAYWPSVARDESAPADQQEIGRRNDAMRKVVISDSLTAADTDPWSDSTTIVRRADAHRAVAELKAQDGADILTFGSGTMWNDLLAAGLVDELHVMVGATVLGGGTPTFGAAQVPEMRLVDVLRRDGSENVLLRYRPR